MDVIQGVTLLTASNWEVWKVEDRVSLMHYGACVSKEFKSLISGTTDGAEAWKILREHFEPTTKARIIQLLDEFFGTRYVPGESLGLFICRVKRSAERLWEVGHDLTPLYQGYKMIRSLPDDFRSTVQAIYRWSDKDFVPDKIQEELLLEENRLGVLKRTWKIIWLIEENKVVETINVRFDEGERGVDSEKTFTGPVRNYLLKDFPEDGDIFSAVDDRANHPEAGSERDTRPGGAGSESQTGGTHTLRPCASIPWIRKPVERKDSSKNSSSGKVTDLLNLPLEEKTNLAEVRIPKTYREATRTAEAADWEGAMDKEMQVMYDRKVWILVEPPKEAKVLGCRWVYSIKHDEQNEIVRYKARLVAQGFKQVKDDIVMFGETKKDLDNGITLLQGHFDLKILGKTKKLLDIEEKNEKLYIHQCSYIEKLCRQYERFKFPVSSLPIPKGLALSKLDCPSTPAEINEMSKYPYRNLIGSLSFIVARTRPDIMYAVNLLSQFQSNPGIKHWNSLLKLLGYLKYTYHYKLELSKISNLNLNCYSDSDYAANRDDRVSIVEYILLVDETPISWRTFKQKCISLSNMKTEFVTLTEAAKDLIWQKDVLENELLKLELKDCLLLCDNQGAISFSNSPFENHKTKHIHVRNLFIRNLAYDKFFELKYVPTFGFVEVRLDDGVTFPAGWCVNRVWVPWMSTSSPRYHLGGGENVICQSAHLGDLGTGSTSF
ncbi:retrovirus-related Pol polyprotein from transposon TNT 1-94 [Trichonephila clavipes]|nr:retrovirus-related Pol polyprotein from transposon TNT 1-94 [Trichonephila clavipes]